MSTGYVATLKERIIAAKNIPCMKCNRRRKYLYMRYTVKQLKEITEKAGVILQEAFIVNSLKAA